MVFFVYITSMANNIKISSCRVWGQIYLLPYLKLTHTRDLNGDLELILGWINREVIISKN